MPPKTRGRKARAESPEPVEKAPTKKVAKKATKKKPEDASTSVELKESTDLATSHAQLQAEMAEMKKQLAEALTLKEQLPAVTKEPAATAAAEPVIEYIRVPASPEPRRWTGESSKLGRYNGKTDLEAFLIQFDNFAEYQRWDEPRRVF